jgi:hypothetical protein
VRAEGVLRLTNDRVSAEIPAEYPNWMIRKRLKIELIPRLIEAHEEYGLRYTGESAGAVMAPSEYFVPERRWDAVCQVFLAKTDEPPEPHGSGVLLRIGHRPFLLTAAHVIDADSQGDLLVTTKRKLIPIAGHKVAIGLPSSGRREDDKYDVAYCAVDEACEASLIEDGSVFLERDDVDLSVESHSEDCYMFAGYPWRKTERKHGCIEASFRTMTGLTLSARDVTRHGYRPQDHIIVRFRRKRSKPLDTDELRISPLPHGMSGGAIFKWPRTTNAKHSDFKLAGIATDYDSRANLLIGTRLHCFIRCIAMDYPDLPIVVSDKE